MPQGEQQVASMSKQLKMVSSSPTPPTPQVQTATLMGLQAKRGASSASPLNLDGSSNRSQATNSDNINRMPAQLLKVTSSNSTPGQQAQSAQQMRCYLCETPKQEYSLVRSFSEIVCRGCVNYEGPDWVEQLIVEARRSKIAGGDQQQQASAPAVEPCPTVESPRRQTAAAKRPFAVTSEPSVGLASVPTVGGSNEPSATTKQTQQQVAIGSQQHLRHQLTLTQLAQQRHTAGLLLSAPPAQGSQYMNQAALWPTVESVSGTNETTNNLVNLAERSAQLAQSASSGSPHSARSSPTPPWPNKRQQAFQAQQQLHRYQQQQQQPPQQQQQQLQQQLRHPLHHQNLLAQLQYPSSAHFGLSPFIGHLGPLAAPYGWPAESASQYAYRNAAALEMLSASLASDLRTATTPAPASTLAVRQQQLSRATMGNIYTSTPTGTQTASLYGGGGPAQFGHQASSAALYPQLYAQHQIQSQHGQTAANYGAIVSDGTPTMTDFQLPAASRDPTNNQEQSQVGVNLRRLLYSDESQQTTSTSQTAPEPTPRQQGASNSGSPLLAQNEPTHPTTGGRPEEASTESGAPCAIGTVDELRRNLSHGQSKKGWLSRVGTPLTSSSSSPPPYKRAHLHALEGMTSSLAVPQQQQPRPASKLRKSLLSQKRDDLPDTLTLTEQQHVRPPASELRHRDSSCKESDSSHLVAKVRAPQQVPQVAGNANQAPVSHPARSQASQPPLPQQQQQHINSASPHHFSPNQSSRTEDQRSTGELAHIEKSQTIGSGGGKTSLSSLKSYDELRCLTCSIHLEHRHFVQCPTVKSHKFCFACSKVSIKQQRAKKLELIKGNADSGDEDKVYCPSGKKCLFVNESLPWTFMNNEIETIFRESSRTKISLQNLSTSQRSAPSATSAGAGVGVGGKQQCSSLNMDSRTLAEKQAGSAPTLSMATDCSRGASGGANCKQVGLSMSKDGKTDLEDKQNSSYRNK